MNLSQDIGYFATIDKVLFDREQGIMSILFTDNNNKKCELRCNLKKNIYWNGSLSTEYENKVIPYFLNTNRLSFELTEVPMEGLMELIIYED